MTYFLTETRDEDIPLAFRWTARDHRDGEVAWVWSAGFKATVYDMDGDCSEWTIETREGEILRQGHDDGAGMYHFDVCLLAAEKALRGLIAEPKREVLRG